MAVIGARELREKTSQVLRRVREEKAEYIITCRGRPAALLLPTEAEAVTVPPTGKGTPTPPMASSRWTAPPRSPTSRPSYRPARLPAPLTFDPAPVC